MKSKRKIVKIVKIAISLTIITLLVTFGIFVFAKRDGSDSAKVIYVDGFVDVMIKKSGKTVTLVKGMKVGVGDAIMTDSESSVELKLKDGSVVKIGSGSKVIVKELGQIEITKVSRSTFELVKGKIRAVVKPLLKKESKFNIESNNVTLGVRSTDFGMIYDPDLGISNIITIEGCVAIVAKMFPDLDAIEVCTNEELFVSGSDKPGSVTVIDKEKLEKFLMEMELKGTGTGTGDIDPPEITSAFVNNRIDLENIEDILTLTKNDLSIDKKIDISGTAKDKKYEISKVEVSTDGGTAWSAVSGTNSWSFSFTPEAELEYELMMRATNAEGAVSDPDDFGSTIIKYVDLSYQDIAKVFIDNFFGYVKSSDYSGLDDIVSDIYDGRTGYLFSKDELLDDFFDEMFSQALDFTISYSITQVTFDGKSIVISTSWNASSGTKKSQGTTKWWLSQSENFTLAHTEGGWFGIVTYKNEFTLENVKNDISIQCPDAVKILLKAPGVPKNQNTLKIKVETICNKSRYLILDRDYYEDETGENNGFGGVFLIYDTVNNSFPCILPPCPEFNPIMYDTDEGSTVLKVFYENDYATIILPIYDPV